MPNNWSLVDTSFPTFTGEEPVKEQIAKIMDYMAILTEMLQYQLQNLDASNWNDSALQDFSDDATQKVAAQVQLLTNQLNALRSTVDSMVGRVSAAENIAGRMREAETAIEELQTDADEREERLFQLETEVQGEGGMAERMQKAETDLQQMAGIVQVAEDGSVTVGAEGKPLYLTGEIYINGVLYQGGTE